MQKITLNSNQVSQLVLDNKYKVDDDKKFLSRCIDGRYLNNDNLPALAIPGADAGEMALILATANSYGFTVDREKAWEALVKTVGGVKNLRFHTDNHHADGGVIGGCGHIGQISQNLKEYDLGEEDVKFVKQKAEEAVKAGAESVVLEGDHKEAAVLMVRGNFAVNPQYTIDAGSTRMNIQVFEFHETLVSERHRALARALMENKAVKLPEGMDEEYLYNALSEEGENHLMETAKRLASGLPIFQVIFKDNGEFEIKAMGKI